MRKIFAVLLLLFPVLIYSATMQHTQTFSWSGGGMGSPVNHFACINGAALLGSGGPNTPVGYITPDFPVLEWLSTTVSGNYTFGDPPCNTSGSNTCSGGQCFLALDWCDASAALGSASISCSFSYLADCGDNCPPSPEYCASTPEGAQTWYVKAKGDCESDPGAVFSGTVSDFGSSGWCVSGECNVCNGEVFRKFILGEAASECCIQGKEPSNNIFNGCNNPLQFGPGVSVDPHLPVYQSGDASLYCGAEAGTGENWCGVSNPSSSGTGGASSSSASGDSPSSDSGGSYCDDPEKLINDPACLCRRDPGHPDCADLNSSGSGGDASSGSGDGGSSGSGVSASSGSTGGGTSSGSGGDGGSAGSGGDGSSGSSTPPGGDSSGSGSSDSGGGGGDCYKNHSEATNQLNFYNSVCRKCAGDPTYGINAVTWPGWYCVVGDCVGANCVPSEPNCYASRASAEWAIQQYSDACRECSGKPVYYPTEDVARGAWCVAGDCMGANCIPGDHSCHRTLSEAESAVNYFSNTCRECNGKPSFIINSTAFPGIHCVVGDCIGANCNDNEKTCADKDKLSLVEKVLCWFMGDGDDVGGYPDGDTSGVSELIPGTLDSLPSFGSYTGIDTGSWRGFVDTASTGIRGALERIYAPLLGGLPSGGCTCRDLFSHAPESKGWLVGLTSSFRDFFCSTGTWLGMDIFSTLANFFKLMTYIVCIFWAVRFFE